MARYILNGQDLYGVNIEVDSELSPTSENPVQNKAIYSERTDNMEKKTITREQWKELCKKYDFWCYYDGISDATYQQAETFIKASAHSDHLFYPMGEFHEC